MPGKELEILKSISRIFRKNLTSEKLKVQFEKRLALRMGLIFLDFISLLVMYWQKIMYKSNNKVLSFV